MTEHIAEKSREIKATDRYCRFLPTRWRQSTLALPLEVEGLLIRIAAFNMESGVPYPACRTTTARMIGVHRNKLDKLLAILIAAGEVVADATGIFSPRAITEFKRSQRAANRVEAVSEYPTDTPEIPQGNPIDTPPVKAEKTQQILRASLEKRREDKGKEVTPLPPTGADAIQPLDCLQAFEAYNALALRVGLPQASRMTPGRQKSLKARLREHGLDGWHRALANIEKSAFLTGGNDRGFRADLDFVLQAKSFSRLHDGGYGNGRHGDADTAKAKPGGVWELLMAQCEEAS